MSSSMQRGEGVEVRRRMEKKKKKESQTVLFGFSFFFTLNESWLRPDLAEARLGDRLCLRFNCFVARDAIMEKEQRVHRDYLSCRNDGTTKINFRVSTTSSRLTPTDGTVVDWTDLTNQEPDPLKHFSVEYSATLRWILPIREAYLASFIG